jgi:hypothetical protein
VLKPITDGSEPMVPGGNLSRVPTHLLKNTCSMPCFSWLAWRGIEEYFSVAQWACIDYLTRTNNRLVPQGNKAAALITHVYRECDIISNVDIGHIVHSIKRKAAWARST